MEKNVRFLLRLAMINTHNSTIIVIKTRKKAALIKVIINKHAWKILQTQMLALTTPLQKCAQTINNALLLAIFINR